MAKQEEKNPSRKTDLENLGTTDTEDDDLNTFDADISLEYTASWGTGVHEFSADSQGGRVFGQSDRRLNEEEAAFSGGDNESNQEDAEAVGDEAVGGSAPTPDQDIVDELGVAVGLEMADQEWLHSDEILNLRDERRWELEPKSSEDYQERRSDSETLD